MLCLPQTPSNLLCVVNRYLISPRKTGEFTPRCRSSDTIFLQSFSSSYILISSNISMILQVNCLAWAPNSLFLASGSLDTSLIIWSVENPMKHLILKKAHPQAQITKVAWIDNRTIVSTGQDSNVKLWDIQL